MPFLPVAISDVSEGMERRLILSRGKAGKLTYLAPEIAQGKRAFDGFAVDVFAAGVILFIMITGLAPFERAHRSDFRYKQINDGRLKDLVRSLDLPMSNEVCDLLQNMLWQRPWHRDPS